MPRDVTLTDGRAIELDRPGFDEYHTADPERPPVVGVCEVCGHELRDTEHEWSEVVGHVCEDGYREHRDGEGIQEVSD